MIYCFRSAGRVRINSRVDEGGGGGSSDYGDAGCFADEEEASDEEDSVAEVFNRAPSVTSNHVSNNTAPVRLAAAEPFSRYSVIISNACSLFNVHCAMILSRSSFANCLK